MRFEPAFKFLGFLADPLLTGTAVEQLSFSAKL
jgi:hypothetical protein